MTMALKIFAALAILLVPVFGAESPEKVFAVMDQAAGSFRTMKGKIVKTTYTKVIKDSSTESGTVAVKRTGPKKLKVLIAMSEPDPVSYAFEDSKAEKFYPRSNLVEIYNLGKQRELVDQFLLLGFGSTRADLEKVYEVKLTGEETVAGQRTARLELVPRSAKTKEQLSRAELWISLSDGHMVQQKFWEASGDYRLVTYSDAKWNADFADSDLKLVLPKNVKRSTPQK